jgi:hypothetical protein
VLSTQSKVPVAAINQYPNNLKNIKKVTETKTQSSAYIQQTHQIMFNMAQKIE